MDGLDGPPHIYHLMARGISKGIGIAADLERRGLTASDAVAVGDSLSDLEMAPTSSRFFLVRNGADVPDIRAAAEALPNVTICDGPLGCRLGRGRPTACPDQQRRVHPLCRNILCVILWIASACPASHRASHTRHTERMRPATPVRRSAP